MSVALAKRMYRSLGSCSSRFLRAATALALASACAPAGPTPTPGLGGPPSPVAGFDAGNGAVPGPVGGMEACDGNDNDQDQSVDEGCACTVGAVQSCSLAMAGKRGICDDGDQTCVATSVEFSEWGACDGVFPAPEIPGDCIDQDCDGTAPGCPYPCIETEICDNGVDDDCDGRLDCNDEDCPCFGGGGDGIPDPFAPDSGVPGGMFPDDGTGDGMCVERCRIGTSRYCDEPTFCNWGKQDCAPDGTWGACTETTIIPEACRGGFGGTGIFGTQYDPACCVMQGLCCQNFGFDPTMPTDASVGNCTSFLETSCP